MNDFYHDHHDNRAVCARCAVEQAEAGVEFTCRSPKCLLNLSSFQATHRNGDRTWHETEPNPDPECELSTWTFKE